MNALKLLGINAVIFSLLAHPLAYSYESGDIIIRAGATQVTPQEDSGPVKLNGSTLSLGGGDSELNVDDNTQLGLNLAYVFNKNWAIELLAATPFEHTASGSGELAGLDIADIKHLPPTLMALYYFDTTSKLKPYLGAGVNYTIFFDEDLTSEANSTLAGLGLTGGDVELDDSWGLSVQAGFDYELSDRWLVNASVRWIDIDTEAEITFDSGDKITADLEIDPFVYTVSIGYRL